MLKIVDGLGCMAILGSVHLAMPPVVKVRPPWAGSLSTRSCVARGPLPQIRHKGCLRCLSQRHGDVDTCGAQRRRCYLTGSFAGVAASVAFGVRRIRAQTVSEVAVAAPAPASAGVEIYFGQGCFWHVQYDLVLQEAALLGRRTSELTARCGYAGGSLPAGGDHRVCYHNKEGAPDYAKLGHAEVVSIVMPRDRVRDFSERFFDAVAKTAFGRTDSILSWGGEYRSVVGLPGGVASPLFEQVEGANRGRLKLLAGRGSDPDTLLKGVVYVYDSDEFPFFQAELYHQFHDDLLEQYSNKYHALKEQFQRSGKLQMLGCPDREPAL